MHIAVSLGDVNTKYLGKAYLLVCENPGVTLPTVKEFLGMSHSSASMVMDMLERYDLVAGSLPESMRKHPMADKRNTSLGAAHVDGILANMNDWVAANTNDYSYSKAFVDTDRDFAMSEHKKFSPARGGTRRYYPTTGLPNDPFHGSARNYPWKSAMGWIECMSDLRSNKKLRDYWAHQRQDAPRPIDEQYTTHERPPKKLTKSPNKAAIADAIYGALMLNPDPIEASPYYGKKRSMTFLNKFAYYAMLCSTLVDITPENVIEKWYREWILRDYERMKLSAEVKLFYHFSDGTGFTKKDFAW